MLITHVLGSEIASIPSFIDNSSGVSLNVFNDNITFPTIGLGDAFTSQVTFQISGTGVNSGSITLTFGSGATSKFSVQSNNWGTAPAISANKATIVLQYSPTIGNVLDTDTLTISFGTYTKTLNLSGQISGNLKIFEYTGTMPTWTVPATQDYIIEMWGASGGAAFNYGPQGRGAYIKSRVSLISNTTLVALVGAESPGSGGGGGSGGGTFLATSDDQPILVAGGGGSSTAYYGGRGGLTTNNGTTNAGSGGGGGSGFRQNGAGTKSFINSKNGGQAPAAGFGGGGTNGGGGYNGGDTAYEAFTNGYGGGGYTSGTVLSAINGGGPSGNGKIIISW